MDETTDAPRYAILELMGHVRLAGRVTEEEKFGAKLGRIDVMGADGMFSYTRYFNAQSIYSLSYVSQDAAVAAARHCSSDPVKPWELPQVQPARAALAAPRVTDEWQTGPDEHGMYRGGATVRLGDMPPVDPIDAPVPTADEPYPAKPAAADDLHRLADDGGPAIDDDEYRDIKF